MINLPEADGSVSGYRPSGAVSTVAPGAPPTSRRVLAAAHLVADPVAANEPFGPPALDWDATLAYRRHLWSLGLSVAEALDTQQRGLGMDWQTSMELVRRSAAEAKAVGGHLAAGVWTDQLDGPPMTFGTGGAHTIDEVVAAYQEQLEIVEGAGAQPIILCSRQLASCATGPEDYAAVYGKLLGQLSQPAIIHWITPMMDPGLTGYWGGADVEAGIENLLAIITEHEDKVDGLKVTPLPLDLEIALRSRLPESVRSFTGDDVSYPVLLAGDGHRHSDALLGVFDPLAGAAARAVRLLDTGDVEGFREVLDPTVELSVHLFEGPGMSMRFYKTGFTFLAWLAGHQDHFRMVWGEQSARSTPHLAKAYRLADTLGLFADPERAEHRARTFFEVNGVAQ